MLKKQTGWGKPSLSKDQDRLDLEIQSECTGYALYIEIAIRQ